MEIYKTYYFETKYQRVSSAAYLRELLYSMFTMLQSTKSPYVPHPTPKFQIKANTSQRDSVGYQILLTWQEFHEKLLQSLDKESISSWTLEELSIWWAMTRFLHACLMEFAFKNGWGACDLENIRGYLPVIEGKVLLNSQHDFNYLFGIEETFIFDEGTKVSQENHEVRNLRRLIGMVQEYIKPLKLLVQSQTQK